MTPDSVRAIIKRACRDAGSQKDWAMQIGVSPAFLSEVLRGTREPSPAILDPLGLERIIVYRKKADAAD